MHSKSAWVWSCAVVLAACAGRIEAAPSVGPALSDPGHAADEHSLDQLPWSERIGLERAMAEVDPRHAPTRDEGRPALAAGGVSASFGDTAELRIGEHSARLRAVSIGRGDARKPLARVPATIAGAEVHAERAPGIVEWWRSLASGLEHGVTIAERPAGEGDLTLQIEVTGLGVQGAGDDSVELTDLAGTPVATYAHLVVTDAHGRVLPATMRAHGGGIDIGVEDADAAYPVVIDPILVARETTLAAGLLDGTNDDNFARGVAISADGTRALMGSPGDDAAAPDAGVGRVFLRTGTTWAEETVLVAPDAASGDSLGVAVALSADGTRAVLGAPGDDTAGGTNAGSARVFVRSGTSWVFEATLAATGTAAGDGLGQSVALASDGSRALLGSTLDDTSSGMDTGSVRVFVRAGTSWSEEATLLAPGLLTGDSFGASVALSSDGSRALVGSPTDSVGAASFCGSAAVFVRTATTWAYEAALLASDRAIGDSFGSAVALGADGSRALIGAPGDDNDGFSTPGSGRVFVRTVSTWAEEATLIPPDRAPGDAVGSAVALTADASRALLGASYDMPAGSARVFLRAGPTWAEGATLVHAGADSGARFGSNVAFTADGSRALVGAFLADTPSATNVGTASVFTVLATLGTPCTSTGAGACASGFCVDGVCCNTACGGGATDCQACSVGAGGAVDGTCGALSVTAAPTVTCRAAAGVCDAPEACSPSSTTCPADVLSPASSVCRPAAPDSCDLAERCSGSSVTCPADLVVAAGTTCRAAAGVCDREEVCNGTSPACPSDARAPASTECRPSLGACDPAEACDGTSTACPANVLAPMGTVCGVAMGDCATPGVCTGANPLCPSAGARPMGTLCRGAISACDVDDFCDGTSQVCTDAFAPATQSCGGLPSGDCDAQDHCTGTSGDCMPTFLAGVECRGSTGACDPEEVCGGGDTECPPDSLSPSGTVCRGSTAACDPIESCDGAAATCPADENTCMADGGETDGGAPPDTGGSDAGGPPPAVGCACAVASPRSVPLAAMLALLLAIVARRGGRR